MGKIKTVAVTEKQARFIDDQSRYFNLSKFVRNELNKYIEFVEEYDKETTN